jgi:hypothetical protein
MTCEGNYVFYSLFSEIFTDYPLTDVRESSTLKISEVANLKGATK